MSKMAELRKDKDKIIRLSESGVSNKDISKIYKCSNSLIGLFLKECGVKSKCVGLYERVDLSEYEEEIIKQYEGGKSAYAISKDMGLQRASIEKLLKSKGFDISKGHRQYKDGIQLNEFTDEIVKIYLEEKIGIDTIAKKFNTSGSSIQKIINKAGVMRDYEYYQYNIDESYFERIDTRNKAYILGFLYADGSVTDNVWRLKLQKKDKYIIDKIKEEIKYNGPILSVRPEKKDYNGKINYSQGAFVLNIARVKMAADLTKLGCMENKTWTLRFPTEEQVPQEFIPDLLRGYWDGDGYVSPKEKTIAVIGNQFFIEELIKRLPLKMTPRLYYKQSTKYKDDPNKKTLACYIGIKHGFYEVLNFLYGNCQDSLYLPRKYELAQYWLKKHGLELALNTPLISPRL